MLTWRGYIDKNNNAIPICTSSGWIKCEVNKLKSFKKLIHPFKAKDYEQAKIFIESLK